METDAPWDDVYAYIGPERINRYADPELWEYSEEFWEVLLEATIEGKVWYSRHRIFHEDVADILGNTEIFGFLMDKMVDMIDDYASGRRTD